MMSVESHHCSRKLFCAFGVIIFHNSVLLDEYSEDTRLYPGLFFWCPLGLGRTTGESDSCIIVYAPFGGADQFLHHPRSWLEVREIQTFAFICRS